MTETQQTISTWARKTFGDARVGTLVARCNEEMAELIAAAMTISVSDETFSKIAEECADVYIVLCQVAESVGVDLDEQVDRKMAKNRVRKWKVGPGGIGQHEV